MTGITFLFHVALIAGTGIAFSKITLKHMAREIEIWNTAYKAGYDAGAVDGYKVNRKGE